MWLHAWAGLRARCMHQAAAAPRCRPSSGRCQSSPGAACAGGAAAPAKPLALVAQRWEGSSRSGPNSGPHEEGAATPLQRYGHKHSVRATRHAGARLAAQRRRSGAPAAKRAQSGSSSSSGSGPRSGGADSPHRTARGGASPLSARKMACRSRQRLQGKRRATAISQARSLPAGSAASHDMCAATPVGPPCAPVGQLVAAKVAPNKLLLQPARQACRAAGARSVAGARGSSRAGLGAGRQPAAALSHAGLPPPVSSTLPRLHSRATHPQ